MPWVKEPHNCETPSGWEEKPHKSTWKCSVCRKKWVVNQHHLYPTLETMHWLDRWMM